MKPPEFYWARRAQARYFRALAKSGDLSAALKAARVERETVKAWMRDDAAFKQRQEDALDTFQDSLWEAAVSRAHAGDGQTLRLLLRNIRMRRPSL